MANAEPVDLAFARRLPKIEVRGGLLVPSATCQAACMGFNNHCSANLTSYTPI